VEEPERACRHDDTTAMREHVGVLVEAVTEELAVRSS
jgi:hypothetical protein